MAIDIGRIAFEAFYAKLYPRAHQEDKLTKWEHIGQHEQDAWRHAAVAVLQSMDEPGIID